MTQIQSSNFIRAIDKKVAQLSTHDVETIAQFITVYGDSNINMSEKISNYLQVSFDCIYELIDNN